MTMYSRLLCILLVLSVCPALSFGGPGSSDAEGMDRVYKRPTIKGTLATVLPKVARMGDRRAIVDWASLERLGVKKTTKVALRPSGASAGQILSLVLAQVARRNKPLGWFEANGVVYVTSQLRALRKDTALIRLGSKPATNTKTKTKQATVRTRREPRRRNDSRISWDGVELQKVLRYVRDAGKVNLVVNWKALESSGIRKSSGVTLKLRETSLATLLDLILEQVNGNLDKYRRAYWVIEKGVVKVTTGTVLNRKTVTKSWDISDLTHPRKDFSAPKMNFTSTEQQDTDDSDDGDGIFQELEDDDDDDEEGVGMTRKQMEDQVVKMIKDSIDRDLWKSGGGKGSIAVYQGKLIITQTQLGWKLLEGR